MAWVTEYDLGWHSTVQNGTIYLQRDGGSYITPLELAGASLEINDNIDGWEAHVARMNCTFTIVNNLSDFYALMPLMTISAGQVKVVVTNDSYGSAQTILFEGFINCEAVSQDMLNFADLTVTASGLLSKLMFKHPIDIDTLQYMTLIDVIDVHCMSSTLLYLPDKRFSIAPLSTPNYIGRIILRECLRWKFLNPLWYRSIVTYIGRINDGILNIIKISTQPVRM
jgi:hypothetical protein